MRIVTALLLSIFFAFPVLAATKPEPATTEAQALGVLIESLVSSLANEAMEDSLSSKESPDLELLDWSATDEIRIRIPRKTIVISRDPATGRITIRIVSDSRWVPDLTFRLVCDEHGCRLQNYFGQTLCTFDEDRGQLHVRCDSDVFGTQLDCQIVNLPESEWGIGLVCGYCTVLTIDGTNFPDAVGTWECMPANELRRIVPGDYIPLIPLIPTWIPFLPRLLPDLFSIIADSFATQFTNYGNPSNF